MTNNMNIIVADVIHYMHIVLMIYIGIGWYVTPIKYIHFYLLFIIFIIFDWNDFDGLCMLTKFENYFRNKNSIKQQKKKDQPEFFRPLFNKLLNVSITSQQEIRITYCILIVVFLFGFLRLLHHYKIMKLPFSR
jgi:hypothetical protein